MISIEIHCWSLFHFFFLNMSCLFLSHLHVQSIIFRGCTPGVLSESDRNRARIQLEWMLLGIPQESCGNPQGVPGGRRLLTTAGRFGNNGSPERSAWKRARRQSVGGLSANVSRNVSTNVSTNASTYVSTNFFQV